MWLPILALLFAPPQASAPSPDHDPERLSRLLAAHDYTTLTKTIVAPKQPADLRSDLDWEKAQLIAGNTSLVAFWYANDLWRTADLIPSVSTAYRETAVMATLYAYGAISIDGARCDDRSAVGHRIDQITGFNPALWTFARTMPLERRTLALRAALMIEQRTAARRAAGDDAFVCRDGLDETTYNLEHGTRRVAPGSNGGTILLKGDGKYVPKIRPEAEWRPEAERTRAALPGTLGRLVDVAL